MVMNFSRVNPRFIGFDISMLNVSLGDGVSCQQHNDKYTGSDVSKEGCFGCKYLVRKYGGRYYRRNIICEKGHIIRFMYVRKDEDGNICLSCPYRDVDDYLFKGCDDCHNSYNSQLTKKCKKGFNISQEVFRIA